MLCSLPGLVASGPDEFPCSSCSRTLETTLTPARAANAPVCLTAVRFPMIRREEAVVRSLVLFACAAAGILGGGALISVAAFGGCLIFVSLCTAAYGVLTYDWPEQGAHAARPQPGGPVYLQEYLQRKAAENW